MRSVDLDRLCTVTDVVLICRISTVTLKWQKCSDMCQNDQQGPQKTHTIILSQTHTCMHKRTYTHSPPLSAPVFWFLLMCTLCQTWFLIPSVGFHMFLCSYSERYLILYIIFHAFFFFFRLCNYFSLILSAKKTEKSILMDGEDWTEYADQTGQELDITFLNLGV